MVLALATAIAGLISGFKGFVEAKDGFNSTDSKNSEVQEVFGRVDVRKVLQARQGKSCCDRSSLGLKMQ